MTKNDSYTISEQIQNAPTIPLPEGFDLDKLKKALKVQELHFATLPIGKAGVVSVNGNSYGVRAMQALVREIKSKMVEGQWGHVKEEDMGTHYEPPAVRWVNAIFDEQTGLAWGKALLLTEEAQRHVNSAEVMGARVGTSIQARNVVREKGEVVDYSLIRLDLANAETVGVPPTAAVPQVSVEMDQGEDEDMPTGTDIQETDARIQEITIDRNAWKARAEAHETTLREQKGLLDDFNEIREMFEIGADDDPVKIVREFRKAHDDLVSENVALLEGYMNNQITEKVKLEKARPMIAKLVRSEKPVTRKQMDRVIEMVLGDDEVKELLKEQVQQQSGPPQSRPNGKPNGQDDNEGYVIYPEKKEREDRRHRR